MPRPEGVGAARAGLVVFALDVERVAAFYERVAGLSRADGGADLVVLVDASDRFELVVHGIPAKVVRELGLAVGVPPSVREDTALKPILAVADLAASRAAATACGGHLGGPDREWSTRGFTACDGWDPEGNVFQLRVSPPSAR